MLIERRRHRRILTLKNFKRFVVLLVVFLAGLSIEISTRSNGDYGRIMQKAIPHNQDIRPQPPPVATAPPVADQTVPDPMLIAPAAREQAFLSTASATPPPMITQGAGSDVRVVGDSSGITIQRASEAPKRPVLAGGIFKQP